MEALRGIRTINEIAQENELAPTQVSQWKKELESRVSEIFASKNEAKNELALKERKEQRLERKVGQLVRACPRGVIAEFEQVPGDILRAKRARFRSLTQKRCLYFFSDKKRATVL